MTRHVSLRAPTVLLVGDAYDDRRMYTEYLRHRRFRVLELDNTADALALAATTDVIVTGIRVPGPFDGVELVRRVRADERTRRKPTIVLTACVSRDDQERARAAGCDAFVAKPCLPDALVAEIWRVLNSGARPSRAMARMHLAPRRRRKTGTED